MTITLAVAIATARLISNVMFTFAKSNVINNVVLALIAGVCSLVRQDNPKQCLTKAGNKVDSIKKCLAMGCCYTVDAAKTKIACYEQSGTVALVQAGAEPI